MSSGAKKSVCSLADSESAEAKYLQLPIFETVSLESKLF